MDVDYAIYYLRKYYAIN